MCLAQVAAKRGEPVPLLLSFKNVAGTPAKRADSAYNPHLKWRRDGSLVKGRMMDFHRVLAAAAICVILLPGCDTENDATSGGDSPNREGNGTTSNLTEDNVAAERAVTKVDPAYVERVNSQIADLEITTEAMKAAAANHPNDELLAKMVDRADKKIPTTKKKVEHIQEVARDENIAELQAEIDDLLATIADAVEKGVKRAAKLDQMPVRQPRQPRERRNADDMDDEVIDDDDGGGANDGSGDLR